ncbi:MAG: hypothetical protein AAB964_02595 [Patescibacteria group bacterium]
MTKNPFLNAGAAIIYIAGIILILSSFVDGPVEARLPLLIPLTMISLFTLSASVMGYIFLYQPMLFILGGKHAEGTTLFLKTVGIFAAYVVVLFAVIFIVAH